MGGRGTRHHIVGKNYFQVRIASVRSEWMIQLLLFSIYVLAMGVLISAVINEPISGVVILIFGVPVTAIYLALAIGGVIISGHSRQNLPEKMGRMNSERSILLPLKLNSGQ